MICTLLLFAFLGAPSGPQPADTEKVSPEMRGDIFMAKKMFREAVDAYTEGSQNDAVLLNKTGIAYHQMMDLRTARRYYERASKVNPEYAEAINNLGTVYYAGKSYRKAISQYKKALRYSPNSASIYSNLGTAFFARKDYKDASVAYEKALSLDPDVFESRNTRGVLLQERSVEERAKFHYYLAKTYAKAGADDRALLYIRKSIEEGFKDKKKFMEDSEFAKIRDLPEFKELMTLEPRVL
ncbi:MAG TPA: tetratricopeptide repeat protein [Bryobacteraceae bacterium]|nr:tetratricopeptide repeat protein [Bryobacteraceae bacterium]